MAIGLKARSKHNNRIVVDDGFRFQSGAEHERYCVLRLLLRAGQISHLLVHPVFTIHIKGHRICKVILDFAYKDDKGVWHHEDVKGYDTAMSILKRKMVEADFGITVEIIR